jgi:DNA-directed RNA polymerase subunit RPC12/RpoP
MMQFNSYKCDACGLIFSTDLDVDEILACPFCTHPRPKLIELVPEALCSRCAGLKQPMSDEELEVGIDGALSKAGL